MGAIKDRNGMDLTEAEDIKIGTSMLPGTYWHVRCPSYKVNGIDRRSFPTPRDRKNGRAHIDFPQEDMCVTAQRFDRW